jgi:hypothetical protein
VGVLMNSLLTNAFDQCQVIVGIEFVFVKFISLGVNPYGGAVAVVSH